LRATELSALAGFGTATVHECGAAVLDLDWHQILPGSSIAGPARLARCPSGDNRAVHEVMGHVQAGEVLVLSMPEPNHVGVLGELLARQAMVRGAAGFVIDAGVRDTDQLRALGAAVWARHVRTTGTTKLGMNGLVDSIVMGGVTVHSGDVVVADSDGVVALPAGAAGEVLARARERDAAEALLRARISLGETTYDMFGLSQ
jgi:4-hydroxy-4-methyl-2-oxoglutarate aldolase